MFGIPLFQESLLLNHRPLTNLGVEDTSEPHGECNMMAVGGLKQTETNRKKDTDKVQFFFTFSVGRTTLSV